MVMLQKFWRWLPWPLQLIAMWALFPLYVVYVLCALIYAFVDTLLGEDKCP